MILNGRNIACNPLQRWACRAFLLVLFPLLPILPAIAQISSGGSPLKSSHPFDETEWINLEEVRVDQLLLEDEWAALTGKKSQRIALEIPVNIRPETRGSWEEFPDGSLVWRAGIRGRGAKALGVVFNRYLLGEGVKVFLFDPAGQNVLGAYTSRNNKGSGILAISYLPGDELIIQMEVPPGVEDYGDLQVGSVRWAYLPVFEDKSTNDIYYGNSESCNVDINCPTGDDWQIVKNSVVRLISGEKCTGVLINNTRNEQKAYVFTAAHCVFDERNGGKYSPPVFYFNYESPTCDGPDGSTAYTISGATLVATGDTMENGRDADSLDFALLELSVIPPPSYKPYYAGWDLSTSPAQHTTAIHHPAGDVKKISVDNDPPKAISFTGWEALNPHSFWKIVEWDIAATEPGSSGCPLFNENKLVIGTLTGGDADCDFPYNDYFTRIDYAWDHYPEPERQLKYWLDPDDTGKKSLPGRPEWEVGTGRVPEMQALRLYPNPASNVLTVEAGLDPGTDAAVSIIHLTGRSLLEKNIPWEGIARIDVSGLPPGIYILRLRQDEKSLTHRFVVNR